MNRVFDASAVLAAIFMEPGGEKVAQLWEQDKHYISSVNYAEVVAKLNEKGMRDEEVATVLEAIPLTVLDFDARDALLSGLMRKRTKSKGFSLGDRACLALGKNKDIPIVTAERLWKDLEGFQIILVR